MTSEATSALPRSAGVSGHGASPSRSASSQRPQGYALRQCASFAEVEPHEVEDRLEHCQAPPLSTAHVDQPPHAGVAREVPRQPVDVRLPHDTVVDVVEGRWFAAVT